MNSVSVVSGVVPVTQPNCNKCGKPAVCTGIDLHIHTKDGELSATVEMYSDRFGCYLHSPTKHIIYHDDGAGPDGLPVRNAWWEMTHDEQSRFHRASRYQPHSLIPVAVVLALASLALQLRHLLP